MHGGDLLYEHLVEEVRAGRVRVRKRSFAKGEVVFHEDDPGDTVHLIERGLFAVRTSTTAGRSLIIDVLSAGGVFGEFAVFSDAHRRTTDVDALVPGATLTVERGELLTALRVRPDLMEDLVSAIVVKADNTRRRLVDLLSVPADLRVLRALLLVDALDADSSTIPLTQHDLASLAATTRPTANRVLREEAARGTLSLARGRITVTDAARLIQRAGTDPGALSRI
jgi:CRP-like cAMP-binding protein